MPILSRHASKSKSRHASKSKSRHANGQLKAGARHSTLETDYSCETGYPFDDSRQMGNTS